MASQCDTIHAMLSAAGCNILWLLQMIAKIGLGLFVEPVARCRFGGFTGQEDPNQVLKSNSQFKLVVGVLLKGNFAGPTKCNFCLRDVKIQTHLRQLEMWLVCYFSILLALSINLIDITFRFKLFLSELK